MPEAVPRALLLLTLLLLLAAAVTRSCMSRDLALSLFAVCAACLGIFSLLGPQAALVGAIAILGVFAIGALVYAAITLVARLAR